MPQSNQSWPSQNSIKYIKINKSSQESILNLEGLSGVFAMSTANEVLYGGLRPEVQPLNLLCTAFDKTSTCFIYLLMTVCVCDFIDCVCG